MNKKPFKAVDGPIIMLLAFAFMLVAQVVMSFAIIGVMSNPTAYEIINCIGMFVFQAVFMSVYLVYTKKRNIASTFTPRNKITIWSVLGAILIAIICFFCFIGLAYIFEILLAKTGYTSSEIGMDSVPAIVLLLIATVIVAPICEETIFRSAFLSGVTKVRKDEIGTSFLCGICFALMHMNPSQTVYQFCLGTIAAYITLKCRNVIPAMIIHATSNLLAMLMSLLDVGVAIDEFYMKVGTNWLIMILLCVAAPIIACVLVWLICKYLKKAEQKKYPDKYNLPRKVIWIDEVTKQPIYEGDEVPVITEENRIIQRGFSPFTGAPVLVDRLELQNALMDDYVRNNGEKTGGLGKKSYEKAFGIYFALTIALWFMTFIEGFIL
ncbi:MAG: CPBP family intramembrane metalloprotease [Clostridiales bacterium]|nr:CPBP family intramembrane metalloprotease [Clostridiales bacterium]